VLESQTGNRRQWVSMKLKRRTSQKRDQMKPNVAPRATRASPSGPARPAAI
jgi:hypothetical protein